MAKLILSLDGMVIREYPLTKERTTIGRKPHNDIVIDNLAISGEHAMIMTILNDSFLEDLGSTNGTLVNGQPIKKHFLQNNDVVELGKYKLKYLTEGAAAQASTADFEKTMVLRAPPGGKGDAGASLSGKSFGDTVVNPETMQSQGPGLREAARQAAAGAAGAAVPSAPNASQPVPQASPTIANSPQPAPQQPPPPAAAPIAATPVAAPPVTAATPASSNPAPASAPAPAAAFGAAAQIQGTIQILSGPSAGKELPLSKPLTTLGKPGVQVAVIAKRPQGYFITHVEGAAFPVVNGKQLDAQAHPLNDHDVIELAGVKMEFYLKPAS
jgi:pSer/pThr/pTyr-binding forkhead associated (FHA) protein